MGRYGFEVIDADGHGGEPLDWRRRIPDRFRPQMVEYVRATRAIRPEEFREVRPAVAADESGEPVLAR